MRVLDTFALKVRRAETPFYARLKRIAKGVLTFNMPMPAPVVARNCLRLILFCMSLLLPFSLA